MLEGMTLVDLESLRKSFAGTLLLDVDEGFSAFNYPIGAPGLVARPTTTDDVASALHYASSHALPVSIRSGGHSGGTWTSTPGGLVLDMSGFADIHVTGSAVTVGSGATWGAVAAALKPHNLALTSGDTASVGVGGLTLGGGVGWIVRKYGLAVDNLVSARLVTASGELLTVSETENSDLFWAIRGGGGNFGVVIDFTFEAHRLDGVVHGVISCETEDLAALLRAYRDVMRASAEELNATFLLMPPMGPEAPGGPQIHVVWAGSDAQQAMAAIQPLLDIPGVLSHDIAPKAYLDVLDDPQPPEGEGGPMPTIVGNNGWAADLSDEAIDAIAAMIGELEAAVLMIRYLRGAFNRVPHDATAFAWRDAETLVIAVAFLPPDSPAEVVESIDRSWVPVSRFTRGTYGNFVSHAGEKAVGLMYPAATRARLAAIKHHWDPQNLFNQNQNIEPIA
jgi:FAD/FMN-containing dehydrogenase